MAARRVKRLRNAAVAGVTNLDDGPTSRAVDQVRAATQQALDRRDYQVIAQDLKVGANQVAHSLGREPKVALVTPTIADTSFAYGMRTNTPNRDRQVVIDVVGVAQPGASILVS